ncbi:MAG: flavin reductase family protein, partial [Mycobacteriales bacterium]
GVHVLRRDQQPLAELFGSCTGDTTDKFAEVRWRQGPHGVPLLEDCAGWLVGAVLAQHELGDHVGFLIEPVASETSAKPLAPLMFAQVKHVDAGHEA